MAKINERTFNLNDWRGKTVRHFKGDQYLFVDVVEHTETGEYMVMYVALYEDCKKYVRPLNMFLESCSEEQFNEYGQEYRFEIVTNESKKKA